jgi:thioredoxin 2
VETSSTRQRSEHPRPNLEGVLAVDAGCCGHSVEVLMATIETCAACGKKNRVPVAANGVPRCAGCHQSLPWVVDASEAEFRRAVDASVLVLVDLWAPWCGPCRTVGPMIEKAARDRGGRLKVVKVNVDDAPSISQSFGVQGIPTMVLLRNGREVSRRIGALPDHALRAWLDEELNKSAV